MPSAFSGTINALARFASGGLSLIFPPCCAHCERPLDVDEVGPQLCFTCSRRVFTPTPGMACPRCGAYDVKIDDGRRACLECRGRKFAFDEVSSSGKYEGALQAAIVRMKTEFGQPLAMAAGKQLAKLHDYDNQNDQIDLVTCIPKYWLKRLATGVNSAETIMAGIVKQSNLVGIPQLLACRRKIRKQSLLSPDQRKRNVHGAWTVTANYDITDTHVLVVDDTMTTGSTAHEVARILKLSGARRISFAVVARASKRH